VGANIGAIALPFARARPDWTVLAVEAHRGLSGLLAANAFNNGLYTVEVINAAAGPARGLAEFPAEPLTAQFNFGLMHFIDHAPATETVRMLTLDELAPAATRLVKIDVEGFEPQVLKGAERLLRSHRAIWLAEASVARPEAGAEAIRILGDAGYALHWFYAPFATPACDGEPPENPARGDANVVALPPGVENIWGLPPVGGPEDARPGDIGAYPYLARYGYTTA
jgi:FkbM family methyltransferase